MGIKCALCVGHCTSDQITCKHVDVFSFVSFYCNRTRQRLFFYVYFGLKRTCSSNQIQWHKRSDGTVQHVRVGDCWLWTSRELLNRIQKQVFFFTNIKVVVSPYTCTKQLCQVIQSFPPGFFSTRWKEMNVLNECLKRLLSAGAIVKHFASVELSRRFSFIMKWILVIYYRWTLLFYLDWILQPWPHQCHSPTFSIF